MDKRLHGCGERDNSEHIDLWALSYMAAKVLRNSRAKRPSDVRVTPMQIPREYFWDFVCGT